MPEFLIGSEGVIIVAMSRSLAPSLLLSMPQLMDPNFNRTVVLLCNHSDRTAHSGWS